MQRRLPEEGKVVDFTRPRLFPKEPTSSAPDPGPQNVSGLP